jgi:uncharacterized membrane protein
MRLNYLRLCQNNGSILLWTLGCFSIALLVIMATISIMSVSQTQRELQHLTDAAALSAANQLSLNTYSSSGNFSDISINSSAARTAVSVWLSTRDPNVRIESFSNSGMTLSLITSTAWRPIWPWLGGESKTLTAVSKVGVDQAAGG